MVVNPSDIYDQTGAGSVAGSKDPELNTPTFGVDLEAFEPNFIAGKVPYETDLITPFTGDTSQDAPKGDWDQ